MAEIVSLLPALGVLLGVMCGLWLVSVRLRDVSIVDIAWGPAFFVLATGAALTRGAPEWRGWLLLGLVGAWGGRLALHLARRNLGHGEDARYAAIRARFGPSFPWTSLFIVFWLQGVLAFVVALPVTLGVLSDPAGAIGLLDVLGTALFAVGLGCEAIGDAQLAAFKRDPANRGRVLDTGLWRYSRHPNYFGDCLLWWGLSVLGWAAGAPAWTAVGPLLMTWLLLRVSGVALLESTIVERRPAYRDYIARTSAFLPWPPKAPPGNGA